MTTFSKSQILRGITICVSFIIVSLILWNTYIFFQKFKTEERQKMEIIGQTFESMGDFDLNCNIELESFIIANYNKNPMIETDKFGAITNWINIGINEIGIFDSLSVKDQSILKIRLNLMKSQNSPIQYSYNAFDANIKRIIYISRQCL